MKIKELVPFRNAAEGDIGLELEFECKGAPVVIDQDNWVAKADGSLRNGIEYVMKKPVTLSKVKGSLNRLFELVPTKNLVCNYRAGIHTHVNVRELTPVQIVNFYVLYSIFEECILELCDPVRRSNLFCLTNDLANGYSKILTKMLDEGNIFSLDTNDIRYSSINLKPVIKYGSVEFRSLESTTDVTKIYTWAKVLYTLKQKALDYANPEEIMRDISSGNFTTFTKGVFGDMSHVITECVDWQSKVRLGIINSQDVAYSRDWSTPDLYIFKKDKNHFV